MKPVNILVVGDVLIDRYYHASIEKLSQEAAIPILKIGEIEDRAGGAGKTATALNELLCKLHREEVLPTASFVGFAPPDFDGFGRVNSSFVYPPLNTNIKKFFCYKNRIIVDVPYQQLTRFDEDVVVNLDQYQSVRDSLTRMIKGSLDNNSFNITIVSDYDKGIITKELLATISQYSDLVIIDPRSKPFTFYSDYADIITPNNLEYKKMFSDPRQWTEKLESDNAAVIRKTGKDGCILYYSTQDNTQVELKLSNIETISEGETNFTTINTVGAGDVFAASLSIMLGSLIQEAGEVNKEMQYEKAAKFASIMATMATYNKKCSLEEWGGEIIEEIFKRILDVQ